MSIALPKQKHLRGPLLDYLRIAEDNGDLFAWRKACEIGRKYSQVIFQTMLNH